MAKGKLSPDGGGREGAENGNVKEIHYLSSPDGLFAIYTRENGTDENLTYILKDHLGSVHCLLDEAGNLLEELSFDAWGKRRNPETWQSFTQLPDFTFDRGYTGHEHLDLFSLINMNGRVYDPVIGRFLSPDIVLQTSGSIQGLNKYTYANNNPLVYTDPDGNFPWLIVGIGSVFGGFQGYLQGKSMGATGGEMFRYIARSTIHGGVTSAFGAWSAGGGSGGGSLFKANPVGALPGVGIGLAEGGLAGAFTGGISSAAMGGNFWEGAKWGGIYGGVSGGIVGGYSGFRAAKEAGLNPWTGGLTLQTKLDIVVKNHLPKLKSEFGDTGSGGVLVGSNENLKGTGFRSSTGRMFGIDADGNEVIAEGATAVGTGIGVNESGFTRFDGNTIYLSKHRIRLMWRMKPNAERTLFHEWYHKNQYYSGRADKILHLVGNYKTYKSLMEIEAWSYSHKHFPGGYTWEQLMKYAHQLNPGIF